METNALQIRGASEVLRKAEKLLMQNEQVLAAAQQSDLACWWLWPRDGVVVTSHRIMFLKNGFFSFSFKDFHWEHVEDVHMGVAFAGATVSVSAAAEKKGTASQIARAASGRFRCEGLVKDQAEHVYRAAQEMEHSWRETNRQRVMEESRAAHGRGSGAGGEPAERLRKLKELHASGVINDREYEEKKAVLIKLL